MLPYLLFTCVLALNLTRAGNLPDLHIAIFKRRLQADSVLLQEEGHFEVFASVSLFRCRTEERSSQHLYHYSIVLTLRVPGDYSKALNGAIWDSPRVTEQTVSLLQKPVLPSSLDPSSLSHPAAIAGLVDILLSRQKGVLDGHRVLVPIMFQDHLLAFSLD